MIAMNDAGETITAIKRLTLVKLLEYVQKFIKV